jgi:hypothetical protein
MSDNSKYTAGLQNVGSYQVAGSPYLTASTVELGKETKISFPRVTNNITIKCDEIHASIEMSGTFDYSSSAMPFAAESNSSNYSVSLWVSASGTGLSDNAALWSFGHATRNVLREKSGKWQFMPISEAGDTPAAAQATVPSGWHFLVAVGSGSNPGASGDIHATIYLNNTPTTTNIASTNTTPNIDFNGGDAGKFFVGPFNTDTFADTIKFRDLIVWSDALTSAQVSTLYNSGDYYNPEGFSVAKKIWIKDSLSTSGTDLVPVNSTGSLTFGINSFGSGDLVQTSTDSPFNSSGGNLQIYYRSTSSLPNVVANKHYWTLDSNDESIKMNTKTKEVYLSAIGGGCDFSIQAGLTNISAGLMYQHTGSGVDE